MNSYPDFREHGYQILRELGRNREGGRISWLASDVETAQQVVLKQFCFAQFGSSWSGFEAHQREIQILQRLAHPGIPRYISSFATSDGFCLVQEYIHAQSLAARLGDLDVEEIKQIAVKCLEILTYLQNLYPPVIHRDIKPENILVDEELNIYLIDFGFARIGSQEVAGSSVFKGTPGFMPPEQMFQPTKATDLYALGTTLICMLTQIKSTEVIKLCHRNNPYLIKFSHLLPQLSLRFLGWLENMVQPEQDKRFANAEAALAALHPVDVMRLPGVDFSETVLQFKANQLGDKLTQMITVENTIPDTLLQGKWEVAPHPHDPPHNPDYHDWISVRPAKFNGNNCQCQIKVDTSKLMADKQYKRQLILHSNAYPATHTLTVKVQTASLPIEKSKISYAALIWLFLIPVVTPIATKLAVNEFINLLVARLGTQGMLFSIWPIGLTILVCLGLAFYLDVVNNPNVAEVFVSMLGLGVFCGAFAVGFVLGSIEIGLLVGYSSFAGLIISIPLHPVIFYLKKRLRWAIDLTEGSFTTVLKLLTLGFGASVGTGIIIGFLNPLVLLTLTGTSLPALSMLLYFPLKRRWLIAKYRQSEKSLIKP